MGDYEEKLLRARELGLPWPANLSRTGPMQRLYQGFAGNIGGALRHPSVVRHVESASPGLGRSFYETGNLIEEMTAAEEAKEQERSEQVEARTRQAMGGAYQGGQPPAEQPVRRQAETAARAVPAPIENLDLGLGQGANPAVSGLSGEDGSVAALIEMQKWKQGALADKAGQRGPFAVQPGRGAFTPSAQMPDTAGMNAEQFDQIRGGQSPGVQRLMDESRQRIDQNQAQASAIELAQAQARGMDAQAGLQTAQAAATQRGARPLMEQIKEQDEARNFVLKLVQMNPQAKMEAEVLFKSWLAENTGASEEEQARMQELFNYRIAEKFYPGLLQKQQATDPDWSIAALRSGMPFGGVE